MKIVTKKSESILDTFKRDRERQVWGYGTGTLCKINKAESSVNIIHVDSIDNLEKGEFIDIHEGTVITEREITFINPDITADGYAVTISGAAVTVTLNTVITRFGAKDDEITGVMGFLMPASYSGAGVSWDNVYANINRNSFPDQRPVFKHFGGTPTDLDLDYIDDLVFAMNRNGCSDKVWLFMRSDLLQAIKKARQAQGYTMEYTNINLGYRAPVYECPKGTFPIVTTEKAPANAIVGLDLNVLSIRRPKPFDWATAKDGSIFQWVKDYDLWQAMGRVYEELFCVKPKVCGIHVDLKKPTT
jgi:hypothetical protein